VGGITATLRNPGDTANWVATGATRGDRQARIKLNLTTTNPKYTPFVLGSYVRWNPLLNVRNTTPVMMPADKVHHLEFSEDFEGRFEGAAVTRMVTVAERTIAARGDTTFLLERCDNPTATVPVWATQGGGLAQLAGNLRVVRDEGGMWYEASWSLRGMEARFDEVTQFLRTAFDGVPVGDAINVVLTSAGFAPINPLPAGVNDVVLPPVPRGQNWRFGTKPGDKGSEIIAGLLLFLRQQKREWRLRYDWDAAAWRLELKPYDLSVGNTWVMTPYDGEANPAARWVQVGSPSDVPVSFEVGVNPPEFNALQCFGLSTPDPDGERIPGDVIVNDPSRINPSHPDYLGREIGVQVLLASLKDPMEIARMTRRLFDVAGHRELRPICQSSDYYDALRPGRLVLVRGESPAGIRGTLVAAWLKRRTVVLAQGEGCVAPRVTYSLSTTWEGGISD
jgi:hypothetical protein